METRIILFCMAFLFISCVQMKGQPNYKEKVEKLGKDVQQLKSPEGKFTLFYGEEAVADGQETVKFLVVENKTEELVFQDSLANASLSWHSDSLLLVEQRLGILQKDVSENGVRRFLLNPVTGRKSLLPQNTNSH